VDQGQARVDEVECVAGERVAREVGLADLDVGCVEVGASSSKRRFARSQLLGSA
jgi:hypothetical protein